MGGVEAAFTYLVKELALLPELDLHVITLGDPSAGTGGVVPDGATLHILPPFPRFEFARNFATYQGWLDKKLAEIKPDVVHAQAPPITRTRRCVRVSHVITVHGIQTRGR